MSSDILGSMKFLKAVLIFIVSLFFVVNTTASLNSFQVGLGKSQAENHCSEHDDSDSENTHSKSSSHDHSQHPCCMHSCHWLGFSSSNILMFLNIKKTGFYKSNSTVYTSQFIQSLFRPPISVLVI